MKKEKNIVFKNIKMILDNKSLSVYKELEFRTDKEKTLNIFLPYLQEFKKLPDKTIKLLSFNVFIITDDKKLLICERKNSFVYCFFHNQIQNLNKDSDIHFKNNLPELLNNVYPFEFKKMFSKMKPETKLYILNNYKITENDFNPDFKEFVLPGGKFDIKNDNDFMSTLLREIQEECSYVNTHYALFNKQCCYVNIFDTLIRKYFHCFSFLMLVEQSSEYMKKIFVVNKEVKGINFIDIPLTVKKHKTGSKLDYFLKIADIFVKSSFLIKQNIINIVDKSDQKKVIELINTLNLETTMKSNFKDRVLKDIQSKKKQEYCKKIKKSSSTELYKNLKIQKFKHRFNFLPNLSDTKIPKIFYDSDLIIEKDSEIKIEQNQPIT